MRGGRHETSGVLVDLKLTSLLPKDILMVGSLYSNIASKVDFSRPSQAPCSVCLRDLY